MGINAGVVTNQLNAKSTSCQMEEKSISRFCHPANSHAFQSNEVA